MNKSLFKSSERMLIVLMASAAACLVISLLVGALAALYYAPEFSGRFQDLGISLVQLRPLHTTFAASWIFLGAVCFVHKYLFDTFGEPSVGDKKRFRAQMVLWGIAGLGILVSVPLGFTSGREYLGFHPIFSLAIAAGWILFAITFFRKVGPGFWERPVYVYMWSAGILYFLYTFAEGHAYLLPFVRKHPVADLAIQWKSCGTLVASFNLMIYGALIYLGERLSGDKSIGQSRTAFALFGVGLLNAFTNYAHHTYHIPQSHVIKWIAFLVSMLEIIILIRVYQDVVSSIRKKRQPSHKFDAVIRFTELSKYWNLGLLSLAVLISVPPWNSLIHGTHVVVAHAMVSMLAIDSYILFAVMAFMLVQLFPKRETIRNHINSVAVRRTINLLNASLVGFFFCILGSGLITAVTRYLDIEKPWVMQYFPYFFMGFGLFLGSFILRLIWLWLPPLLEPERNKVFSS